MKVFSLTSSILFPMILLMSAFSTILTAQAANFFLINTHSTALNQAANLFKEKKLAAAKLQFKSILKSNKKSIDSQVYLARINVIENNFDKAEDNIKIALKLAPNNAYVQNLSGEIYAVIAQNASIFSALGYAKKCLQGFRNAVKIEPNNIDYRQALISFYLAAPSIAGGDEELAMQSAQVINKLDNKQGYIAIGKVLNAMGNKKALIMHLANTPANIKNDPQILLSKGFIYQQQKEYTQALLNFKNAINQSKDVTGEDALNIKYQALYQLGKTSDISKQQLNGGVTALRTYIKQAPKNNRLASKEWAQFRLASIIETQGDKTQAKLLYQQIAKNTNDKRLRRKVKKRF